ncbi:MAG: GtrA family protein [Rhizobiales bacterium]|nr:GtrA family protein [Hyphomicrobiales bacterium]
MTLLSQYVKFMINGGVLGVVSLFLQAALYHLLGGTGSIAYATATLFTYVPLIVVNFCLQRTLIFSASGRLWKFILANAFVMLLVSAISPICRVVVADLMGGTAGDRSGFLLASLIGATPSFLLSRHWVFQTERNTSHDAGRSNT